MYWFLVDLTKTRPMPTRMVFTILTEQHSPTLTLQHLHKKVITPITLTASITMLLFLPTLTNTTHKTPMLLVTAAGVTKQTAYKLMFTTTVITALITAADFTIPITLLIGEAVGMLELALIGDGAVAITILGTAVTDGEVILITDHTIDPTTTTTTVRDMFLNQTVTVPAEEALIIAEGIATKEAVRYNKALTEPSTALTEPSTALTDAI